MTNPWIDQLVPNQVAVNSTSDVTITGNNFTANSQAKFDGTPVVTTYVSSTQITAQVDQSITAAPAIEYQNTDGVVNTSTSPKVQYTYADGGRLS